VAVTAHQITSKATRVSRLIQRVLRLRRTGITACATGFTVAGVRSCSCAPPAALREHFAQHVLAGFDKARVGLDRPRRLAGGVALAEIQVQALDDLPGLGASRIRSVARNTASSMSWVIRNTGLAVRCQTCSSSSCICSRVKASRAPKGSSISSTRGSAARARARPTRCFWPPDSCQMRRLSKPARSTSASISGRAFALRLGHAGQFQAEADVGQHVLPGQQGVVLEHHAAFGARAFDRHAVEGDAPGAGFDETGNQVQQRGLATAGRAEGHQQLLGPRVRKCPPAPVPGAWVLCADALQL
jgi:hypothetical protein